MRKEAGDNVDAQIDRAFRLALGRAPSKFEAVEAVEYVRGNPQRLAEFARAIFNLNEFVYRQ